MENRRYLSVDIGSQNTRAWLFEPREDGFALVCSAASETSAAVGQDIRTGVNLALEQLQEKAGLRLLDLKHKLIRGEEGVEACGLSLSAGKAIRTVLIGVSDTYSLAALRRLVSLFYTDVVLEIDLQDDLNATAQLEKLINANADLFVASGGVNEGAFRPVRAALDNLRIVYQSLPRLIRPQLVYAGNEALSEYAREELDAGEDFHSALNVQARIDTESLSAGWPAMLSAFSRLRRQQLTGLTELEHEWNCAALPSAFAASRIVRLIDRMNPEGKGAMALDVGCNSTIVIASRGSDFIGAISHPPISNQIGKEPSRYATLPIDARTAATYMLNKKLHQAFLPATLEDLAVEQAWTRVRLQDALRRTRELFPWFAYDPELGLLEPYEPVLLSGESLVRVPAAQQTLLMALDGLRPHGITTFAMDKDQLLAGLGSLADKEPLLPVQLIDSGVFANLGTVICADAPERAAKRVLTLEIDRGESARETLDVRKGEIKRVETTPSSRTRIYLSPGELTDVGMGLPGLGGWVTVPDSELGTVVDARGRPLELPDEMNKRSEAFYNWLWELGG